MKRQRRLKGAQAEHMVRVLRAQPGVEADVVAGGQSVPRGGRCESRTTGREGRAEVRFNLVAEVEADPALPVTLVMSIFKFDHMEWAIEKATELGVAAIAPVIARRTEKHLAQAAMKRVERWRRIAHRGCTTVAAFRCSGDSTIREAVGSREGGYRIGSALCWRSRSARRRCAALWRSDCSGRHGDAGTGTRYRAGGRMGSGRRGAV